MSSRNIGIGSVLKVDYASYCCMVFFEEQSIAFKCFMDELFDLSGE